MRGRFTARKRASEQLPNIMIFRSVTMIERWRKRPFVKQVGGMMMLTAAGQGLYLAAGPFIGRIYTPEQVGLYGLFMTIWMLLALFACGLFELAIPTAKDDHEAHALTDLSYVLGLSVALISGVSLTIATDVGWFGLKAFPIWMGAIMVVAMLAQTHVLIGQAWSIRRNKVLLIGRANLTMNGLRGGFQVFAGLLSPLWGTMLAAEIASRIVQAQHMNAGNKRRDGAFPHFKITVMTVAMFENKRYPIVFGPAFALDSGAMLLQTGMIGMLFGAGEMGQYFLMRRTLDLPLAFAFKSLSDLFFARQIVMLQEAPDQLRPFFVKSAAGLAFCGALAGAPVLFFGPELFKFFYGPAWELAGGLAAIMVPSMVLNLAVAPVARVFQLSRWAHLRLLPGVAHLVGTLLVLWLALRFEFSIIEVSIGIAVVIALQYCLFFCAGYAASSRLNNSDTLIQGGID